MSNPLDSLPSLSHEAGKTVNDILLLAQIAGQVYENSVKIRTFDTDKGGFTDTPVSMANIGNRDNLFIELVKAYLRNAKLPTKGGNC